MATHAMPDCQGNQRRYRRQRSDDQISAQIDWCASKTIGEADRQVLGVVGYAKDDGRREFRPGARAEAETVLLRPVAIEVTA